MSIHPNDDGAPNVITYLFTDLFGNRIDELPINGSSFTLQLNASGPFTGTLNLNDPNVQKLNWQAATAPNEACVWVDIDGTLVYGGIVNGNSYTKQTGILTVNAADHYTYLTQRLQAKDYSTTWATTAAGAAQIAYTVITDALAVSGSLPLSVFTPAVTPAAERITMSVPLSQRSTVDSIVSQNAQLGWLVGFDYAVDVAYIASVPTATITLSYPRRGRIAGTTGLLVDLSSTSCIDYTYPIDGTQQANQVAETMTAAAGAAVVGAWQPAIAVDGYPLLEAVGTHTGVSSGNTPQAMLNAYIANDLALYAYPATVPSVTLQLFGEPAIGDFIVGDDVRLIIPATAGEGPPQDPRFPNGLDFYWRVTQVQASIPDEGIPTMVLTFNMPPTSTPQRPPT